MTQQRILATSMGRFTQLLQSLSKQSCCHYLAIASDKLAISQLQSCSNSNFNYLPEDIYFDEISRYNNDTIYSLCDSLESKLGIHLTQLVSFDRRFCYGSNVKFIQSYTPRFSYKHSVKYILSISRLIDECFDKHSPTICINFGSSNIADVLLELYAKYYAIKFRQIKSAKVANLLNSFPSGLNYDFLSQQEFDKKDLQIASDFIDKASASKVKYEGSIKLSKAPVLYTTYLNAFRKLPIALASFCKYLFLPNVRDHHFINPLSYWYFSHLSQPLRWMRSQNLYPFLDIDTLKRTKNKSYYLLFPLHHEPEVSIQVYGSDSLNQIEVIRKLSLGTPHDVVILIKEHPRSIGFRSNSFYSKLQEIPKVIFVSPYVTSTQVLSITDMSAVISSSISLESACKKLPVLHFGDIFLQGVSTDMVLRVSSISSIRRAFSHLRYNYNYNHTSLLHFIAKYISGSLPVNLYSSILAKSGRESYNGNISKSVNNLQSLIEAR